MSHVSGSLTGSRNTILELAQSIKNLLLLKKYLSFINLEEKNKSSWKQLWRNVSVVKFSLVEGLSKSASLRCFLLFLLFKKVKKKSLTFGQDELCRPGGLLDEFSYFWKSISNLL